MAMPVLVAEGMPDIYASWKSGQLLVQVCCPHDPHAALCLAVVSALLVMRRLDGYVDPCSTGTIRTVSELRTIKPCATKEFLYITKTTDSRCVVHCWDRGNHKLVNELQ